MFPGYEVPDIHRELNNVLQPQCQQRTIIVQCAGNDIERRCSDHVIVQHEMLINDITRMYHGVAVLCVRCPLVGLILVCNKELPCLMGIS